MAVLQAFFLEIVMGLEKAVSAAGKKEKKRIGREFSNEFSADPFFVLSRDLEKKLLKIHRSTDIIIIKEGGICHADQRKTKGKEYVYVSPEQGKRRAAGDY